MAIAHHIVLKPRWVRPATELSQQDYSSVVFAIDSQEIHQSFLTKHKTLSIFGVIAKTRGWSDRPPLIQCNRCWEFGHRTPRCQAPEPRCRICGDKHPESEHPRPSQPSIANNMVTNCDLPSEAMCIHCKREGRQSTNHPANWTQCPERRLRIGNNRATGPSQPKLTTNQTKILPKRTRVPRKSQSTTKILVESNTIPTPNTLPPLQAESITDLAQIAGIDITNIPEAEVRQVLTAALMKYKTQI